ncbi:unnamed protein product [Acanthoscelides obtectus]|uniref:Uncharacterized protein n=1 Tax=Acanthoscelides obtectus TaxID=200917 RepID=A0A9P0PTX8_ACAOB|nr:unnamed protein product [Acanthoscelides obtectus]CAK1641466.1 hypothetical protein AOBTE_LOCUS12421 [Acanthoscelides obtectus]
MASWSRNEIRAVLRYNFTRGLSIDQCLEEMMLVLNNGSISLWRTLRGREGRQRTSVTEESITEMRKMLADDRRVTNQQIEETFMHQQLI